MVRVVVCTLLLVGDLDIGMMRGVEGVERLFHALRAVDHRLQLLLLERLIGRG